MDIFCAIIPVGSLIGRRGNFLNQELYGRAFTDVFDPSRLALAQQWFVAVQYSHVDTLWRINSSLIASLTE
jgi:prolipoprotein diacylglyceryltransferase